MSMAVLLRLQRESLRYPLCSLLSVATATLASFPGGCLDLHTVSLQKISTVRKTDSQRLLHQFIEAVTMQVVNAHE